ncbi:hypothetical protein BZG36_01252 [Bifiguratus adelaidae]|uniref:Uncharacterized protein n=1 Tax=Bifiguratus adelaidae TaxID=1938954 RepID=A0A261Y5S7_9FUNG|nr:hypothetical protein BZG36_01252 [Bifiguratus adelaidae]
MNTRSRKRQHEPLSHVEKVDEDNSGNDVSADQKSGSPTTTKRKRAKQQPNGTTHADSVPKSNVNYFQRRSVEPENGDNTAAVVEVPTSRNMRQRPEPEHQDETMDAATVPSDPETVVLYEEDSHMMRVEYSKSNLSKFPHDLDRTLSYQPHSTSVIYDPISRFVVLATETGAHVWVAMEGMEELEELSFVLPLPVSTTGASKLIMVPALHSIDPGLLAYSSDGEIWFWENLRLAMGSPSMFRRTKIFLSAGEKIEDVIECEPRLLLCSTSLSNVHRISLYNASGLPELTSSPIARISSRRPQSSASPFAKSASTLWGNLIRNFQKHESPLGDANDADNRINSLKAGRFIGGSSREVYITTPAKLQVWMISRAYPDKLILEHNMRPILQLAIRREIPSAELAPIDLNAIRMLDTAISHDHITIVVALPSRIGDRYAIVLLAKASQSEETDHSVMDGSVTNAEDKSVTDDENESTSFEIKRVSLLRYNSTSLGSQIAAFSRPRLLLIKEAQIETLLFAVQSQLVLLTLFPTYIAENIIPLRSPTLDPILGFGSYDVTTKQGAPRTAVDDGVQLWVASQQSGLTRWKFRSDGYQQSFSERDLDPKILEKEQFRSALEKVLIFDSPTKPNLTFKDDGSLSIDIEAIITEVCYDVVRSNEKYVPRIMSVATHLGKRVTLLLQLADFLNQNELMDKISDATRNRLMIDYLNMTAAHALWALFNDNDEDSAQLQALISDAVSSQRGRKSKPSDESPLKIWFKANTNKIGELLDALTKGDKDNRERQERIDRIVLCVADVIKDGRQEALDTFHLSTANKKACWFNSSRYVDMLFRQFENTVKLIDGSKSQRYSKDKSALSYARSSSISEMDADLLFRLACAVLQAYKDRAEHIDGAVSASQTIQELRVQHDTVTAEMFRQLEICQDRQRALELALSYQEFDLVIDLVLQQGQDAANEEFVSLADKYGSRFVDALCEHFIRQDRIGVLLSQSHQLDEVIQDYFERHDRPEYSWLHDLKLKLYPDASHKLMDLSKVEHSLEKKKLLLAYGKLSFLTNLTVDELYREDVEMVRESLDDSADFVEVQLQEQQMFNSILRKRASTSKSIEAKAKIVTEETTGALRQKGQERPGFEQVYTSAVQQLLSGQSLSLRQLVNVMTLKDNAGDQVEDYYLALEIVSRAQDLDDLQRRELLETIWRRVYIHDQWVEVQSQSMTDKGLRQEIEHTALFHVLDNAFKKDFPAEYILSPSLAFFKLEREELKSRFDVAPNAQLLKQVWQDYQLENSILDTNIKHNDLEAYTLEVMGMLQSVEEANGAMEVDA